MHEGARKAKARVSKLTILMKLFFSECVRLLRSPSLSAERIFFKRQNTSNEDCPSIKCKNKKT